MSERAPKLRPPRPDAKPVEFARWLLSTGLMDLLNKGVPPDKAHRYAVMASLMWAVEAEAAPELRPADTPWLPAAAYLTAVRDYLERPLVAEDFELARALTRHRTADERERRVLERVAQSLIERVTARAPEKQA